MCVLLVEDDPFVRMALQEGLEDADFEVCAADSCDAALTCISDPPGPLTLLVTDVNTPGRASGLDVASAMRDRHPGAPIIYTTGSPCAFALAEHPDDASAVLFKPHTCRELVRTAQELMASAETPQRS